MTKLLALAALIFTAPHAFADSPMIASPDQYGGTSRASGGSALGSIASRYIGMTGPQMGLPARLWCGLYLNMIRRKAGLRVPSSGRAVDQAQHARRISRPVPGAIVISPRRGGGHADLISAVHADGSVTLIRPNWSRRVVKQRVASVRGAIYLPM